MIEEIILEVLQEIIKKKGNKYCLISKKGKNLGCYKKKSGVNKREKQVNFFKSKKIKKEQTTSANISGFPGRIGVKRNKNDEN